jgi:hypothetical protein
MREQAELKFFAHMIIVNKEYVNKYEIIAGILLTTIRPVGTLRRSYENRVEKILARKAITI